MGMSTQTWPATLLQADQAPAMSCSCNGAAGGTERGGAGGMLGGAAIGGVLGSVFGGE